MRNKNVKQRVMLIFSGVVFLSLLILAVGTNFVINSYIKSQAIETLNQEAMWFKDVENAQKNYDKAQAPLFQVVCIYLDFLKLGDVNDEGIGRVHTQKKMYDFFEENKDKIESDTINVLKTENTSFYYKKVSYRAEADSDKMTDVFMYIEMAPVERLTFTMNIMFAVMILPTVFIAVFAGVKIGKIVENSEQKLKSFFENASHELKTPLMSIQGYAEAIQKDIISDHRKAADVIIEESDRMERLVDGILQISRLDSGARKMNPERVNICEVLREAVFRAAFIALSKKIDVKMEISHDAIYVNCDESAVIQVFDNIMMNGVRYAENSIAVSCALYGDKVKICISDDGPGIAEYDMPHIFERFYHGKGGNTGIGLSLAKDIIELHKGKIEVESNNEDGTRFCIFLPFLNMGV